MSKARKFAEARDKDGNVLIEFMGPARSDDALSVCLRILTHQLQQREPDQQRGGGLFGGAFGYGVAFENDVFMMHPYCWCETSECEWCCACTCPYAYFIDDQSVTEDQYQAFLWAKSAPAYDAPDYRAYFDRVRSERIEPKCAACVRGAKQRPHFHHKPSGLKVRWYKYIGRDMELESTLGDDWTLQRIFDDVLASIQAGSIEDGLSALIKAEEEEAAAFKRSMEFMLSDKGREIFGTMFKMEKS